MKNLVRELLDDLQLLTDNENETDNCVLISGHIRKDLLAAIQHEIDEAESLCPGCGEPFSEHELRCND